MGKKIRLGRESVNSRYNWIGDSISNCLREIDNSEFNVLFDAVYIKLFVQISDISGFIYILLENANDFGFEL